MLPPPSSLFKRGFYSSKSMIQDRLMADSASDWRTKRMYTFSDDQLHRLEELRAAGINPYPHGLIVTHSLHSAREMIGDRDKPALELDETEVVVAGRMMLKRGKGKAGFATIQDQSGALQIYVRKDSVGEKALLMSGKKLLGDIVWIKKGVSCAPTQEPPSKLCSFSWRLSALSPCQTNTKVSLMSSSALANATWIGSLIKAPARHSCCAQSRFPYSSFSRTEATLRSRPNASSHSRRSGGTIICYSSQCSQYRYVHADCPRALPQAVGCWRL